MKSHTSMSAVRKKCQEILLVTSTLIKLTTILSPQLTSPAKESMIFTGF